MGLEQNQPEKLDIAATLEAFHGSFERDIRNLRIFQRETGGLPGSDTQPLSELLQKADTLLNAYRELQASPSAFEDFFSAHNERGRQPDAPRTWTQQAQKVDQWWRDARSLMEEMRWEKSRVYNTFHSI